MKQLILAISVVACFTAAGSYASAATIPCPTFSKYSPSEQRVAADELIVAQTKPKEDKEEEEEELGEDDC